MNTEQFIKKAKEIHGDRYDYTKTEYERGNKSFVTIICKLHGNFIQRYDQHLAGKGCPNCGLEKKKQLEISRRSTTKEFIIKAKDVHGEKYSYEQVEYINARIKVIITCPKHGPWAIAPSSFLLGQGCRKCANERRGKLLTYTKEDFIRAAHKIHGSTYSYNNVVYINNKEKVKITCKKHGDFYCQPNAHISGSTGCPKCKNIESRPEQEIREFVESLGLSVVTTTIERKQIDILVPELKLGIEFNGLYWHSDKFISSTYHKEKSDLCRTNGIRLVQIFEDEWNLKKDIVKEKLRYLLRKSQAIKIGARKTKIVNVSSKEAGLFLDKYHLQGNCASKFSFGLMFNNTLVAIASFSTNRFNRKEIELIRYATNYNYLVAGGLSRLINHFSKSTGIKEIVSYSDNRWYTGTSYEKAGFIKILETKPGYYWNKNGVRINRMKMMKHNLKKVLPNFSPELTEEENCRANGYTKVFNCGMTKWKWKDS